MGMQKPAYIEQSDIATKPSQQYGWENNAPKRIETENGAIVVRNVVGDIKWDSIVPTFNATSDVYVFSYGGSTTATITVSYTDSTKAILSGVTKVLA